MRIGLDAAGMSPQSRSGFVAEIGLFARSAHVLLGPLVVQL